MVIGTTSKVGTSPHSTPRSAPGSGGEPGARTPRPRALASGTLTHRTLTPGTLSPARLGHLVREIAAAEGSWRPIVDFSAERRWYRRLVLAEDHEIWLLSWLPGQHTGFHDHGEARGAFAVAQGELRETLARPGRNRVRNRCASAGSVTTFGASHLHDVSNATTIPAVSVHAYSPPLTAMRRYEMTASGLAPVGTDRAELDW
jgi:mannose-6-phosphate isomerase-like protein (cupin superfamily)